MGLEWESNFRGNLRSQKEQTKKASELAPGFKSISMGFFFLYLKKLKFAFEKLTNQIAQRGSDGAGKRPRPGLPQPPRLLGAPLTQLIVPPGPCRAGPQRQAAVSKPGAPSVLPP